MAVRRKHSKVSLIVTICSAVLILGLIIGFLWLTSDSTNDQKIESIADTAKYKDPTTGVSFNYSKELELKANATPVNGILTNLTKVEPRIQVTVWQEPQSGVDKLRQTDEKLNRAILANTVAQIKDLKDVYPNGLIVSTDYGQTNGYDSSEVTFTYLSDGLETTLRRLMIVKDDQTVINVACQTLTKDYKEVNPKYFQDIISSVSF